MYVGAIAILFLFVIMLIHLKEAPKGPLFVTSGAAALILPLTAFIAFGIEDSISYTLFEFFTLNDTANLSLEQSMIDSVTHFMNYSSRDIKIFSSFLYTFHSSLFFIASLLLLTAMLGAIILATQATDSQK